MAPPKELRRRLEQANAVGKDGAQRSKSTSRSLWAVAAVVLAVAGVFWFVEPQTKPALAQEEIRNPEVLRLLDNANNAIRKKYNYTLALGYIEQALNLEPNSTGVKQFYASVLLALDKVEDAHVQFREVFKSRSPITQDLHFLQQYVLTLHRLDKHEELAATWPQIVATPGVHWREPLQCPDRVDEAFLDGAVPFPRPEELNVPQLMAKHKDAIMNEFNEFHRQPGWSSNRFFKPNQDNDLVLGNEETKWTEMLLFDRGSWDPRFCAIFRTVCKMFGGIRDIEGIFGGKRAGQVSLLKLEAGTTLVPHFGSVNWRYVAHLGLLVPDNVTIFGGNESRQFAQGEVMVLDDSFLHSVRHHGQGPRVTLFATFFHPEAKPYSPEEWYERGE